MIKTYENDEKYDYYQIENDSILSLSFITDFYGEDIAILNTILDLLRVKVSFHFIIGSLIDRSNIMNLQELGDFCRSNFQMEYLIVPLTKEILYDTPLPVLILKDGSYQIISQLEEKYVKIIRSNGLIEQLSLNAINANDYMLVLDLVVGTKRWISNSIFDAIKERQLYGESIIQLKDFLSAEECDELIDLSKPLLKRSKVGGVENCISNMRTSSTGFLDHLENELLLKIKSKALNTFADCSCQVEIQFTQYEEGQEFDVHLDAFNPVKDREIILKRGQRKYTLIIYLNDNYLGGETYFSEIDKVITPVKGCAIGFNNLDSHGQRNHFSVHSGRSVVKGVKSILNIWLYNKPATKI